MPSITAFAAISLLFLGNIASAVRSNQPLLLRRMLIPFSDVTPLEITSKYSLLTRMKASGSAKSVFAARIKGYGEASLQDLVVEEEWAVKINSGGEEFLVVLDTGSSDT